MRGAAGERSELQRAVGLSAVDRQLIGLLQVDGRMSYADLARRLKVPEKRVRTRVHELTESGVIHITTVADPATLGYRHVAMLGIRTRGARPSDLARELIAIPAIDYVILTTGRYQLWVELFCKDLAELREMVEVTVHGLAGVEEVEIFPYLRLRYQADAFQHRENQVLGRGIGAQIPVDQIDRDIVAELSPDGRLALQRVANRLGISEAQVRRRLHRLQSAGAARVMAMTNPFSLGFEAIAKLGVRVAPGHSVAGVADALVDIEEVSYVALCTGRFDILSEVICLDVEALNAALDGRLRQIPGLARVEAFLYLGLHMKSVGVAATTPRGGADAVVSLEPLSS